MIEHIPLKIVENNKIRVMKGRVRNENGAIIWEESGRKEGILLEKKRKELLTKQRCNMAVLF